MPGGGTLSHGKQHRKPTQGVASRATCLISPRPSNPAGLQVCDMLNIVSSKARGEASMSAKNGSIKLVAGNSNPALAQAIADWLHLPPTKAIVRRFADMEIFVEIQENVRGSDVFIIQSTSFPANDHLMELLIITDALRRASARRITPVVPYFGYARQDRKAGSRSPISSKPVANLIPPARLPPVMPPALPPSHIHR